MGSGRDPSIVKLERMDRKRTFLASSIFRKIYSSIYREANTREHMGKEVQYTVKLKKEKRSAVKMRSYQSGTPGGATRLFPIELTQQPLIRAKRKSPCTSSSKIWTSKMDNALRNAVKKYGERNWKQIAKEVEGRDHVQCLQRWRKCIHPNLVKGHWSPEEDAILTRFVNASLTPELRWAEISKGIRGRTAKQCRERWSLNLDPSINKSPWTQEEDEKLLKLHKKMGNKWSELASHVEGRTENMVKGRYKSLVRAQEKLWTIEEDATIIESKCVRKSRWLSISKKLQGRSKNAIRLRWKYLVSLEPSLYNSDNVEDHEKAEARVARLFLIAERYTPSLTPSRDKEHVSSGDKRQIKKEHQIGMTKSTAIQSDGAGVPKRNRYCLKERSSQVLPPAEEQTMGQEMYNSDNVHTPSSYKGKRDRSFASTSPGTKRRKNGEVIDDALAVLSHLWHDTDKISFGEHKVAIELPTHTSLGDVTPTNTYFLRNCPRPFSFFQNPRDMGSRLGTETCFRYFPMPDTAGHVYGDQPSTENENPDQHKTN